MATQARVLAAGEGAIASMPDLSAVSDEPAHARIEEWITGLVARGDLVVEDRLPPEGDLAAALGVSRMTLRQALGSLEATGVVVRKRGRSGGTFVARPRIDVDLTGLPGFTEQMRRAHVRASARVVSARARTAGPAVAEALKISRDTEVYQVVRVRLANREPLALEETYLPASRFTGLLDRRLTGSLYHLMSSVYGHAPHTATEWLEPTIASTREAELLAIEPGSALMLVTRTASTEAGVPIEHAYDRYRADRTRIGLRTGIDVTARAEVTRSGRRPPRQPRPPSSR